MVKMQSKVTDSNMRNIDHRKNKTFRNMDLEGNESDEDENNLGGPAMFSKRAKRQRINSINDNTFASSGLIQSKLPMGAFAALSGISADDEDSKYRVEAKRRGMSDVDDTNIK